jgi:hypothetical protein
MSDLFMHAYHTLNVLHLCSNGNVYILKILLGNVASFSGAWNLHKFYANNVQNFHKYLYKMLNFRALVKKYNFFRNFHNLRRLNITRDFLIIITCGSQGLFYIILCYLTFLFYTLKHPVLHLARTCLFYRILCCPWTCPFNSSL